MRKDCETMKFLDLSWLCYSEGEGNLYCLTCKLFSEPSNQFTEGFNNWKKAGEKLDRHSQLQSHQEALTDAVVHSKTSSRINCQLMQAYEL